MIQACLLLNSFTAGEFLLFKKIIRELITEDLLNFAINLDATKLFTQSKFAFVFQANILGIFRIH